MYIIFFIVFQSKEADVWQMKNSKCMIPLSLHSCPQMDLQPRRTLSQDTWTSLKSRLPHSSPSSQRDCHKVSVGFSEICKWADLCWVYFHNYLRCFSGASSTIYGFVKPHNFPWLYKFSYCTYVLWSSQISWTVTFLTIPHVVPNQQKIMGKSGTWWWWVSIAGLWSLCHRDRCWANFLLNWLADNASTVMKTSPGFPSESGNVSLDGFIYKPNIFFSFCFLCKLKFDLMTLFSS
jgi:hypothetical protein